jgi:hypothetical protein
MTSIEKLDAVLKFISTLTSMRVRPNINNAEINNLFKDSGIEFQTSHEAVEILMKLHGDKYIDWSDSDYNYKINFNGRMFIQQGGYVEQKRISKREDEKIEDMQLFQRVSADKMLYATIILGVGSIGLLIWEIIKYYYLCGCH